MGLGEALWLERLVASLYSFPSPFHPRYRLSARRTENERSRCEEEALCPNPSKYSRRCAYTSCRGEFTRPYHLVEMETRFRCRSRDEAKPSKRCIARPIVRRWIGAVDLLVNTPDVTK